MHPSRRDFVANKSQNGGSSEFKPDGTTSAEAHAKQRALAKERKASRPNADVVQQAKKIWERLRQKLNVPEAERKELLTELFELMEGRIRDFVFKHDSVRVVQTAVKYCEPAQLKIIVKELKDDVRSLVESKYGKFLVAKMVVNGDQEDRNLIIPQFYGHVKKLINHPEASWIVDDIYRNAIATPEQKAAMLREWYGVEFSLANRNLGKSNEEPPTADLKAILEKNPEKRKPILGYLHQMINNLIQKKMTGFTMLHDAMLQYFVVLSPGSEEHTEFLETLKGDIDADEADGGGDLYKNLSFTKSGSRLVSYAIAYGSAKDRKMILKCFKDNIEIMAVDNHAKIVLAVALDVPDDTRNALSLILRELLGLQIDDSEERLTRLEGLLDNTNARLPLLFPISDLPRWLLKDDGERAFIEEIHKIRETTSKKSSDTRRSELRAHLAGPLLDLVAARADNLIRSKNACPAISEILFRCEGSSREAARDAVAKTAEGNPSEDGHVAKDAAASRLLKVLVAGGLFDPAEKRIKLAEPRLGFGEALYPLIKSNLVDWACGESSFVVVAFLESEEVSDKTKKEIKKALQQKRKQIQAAADGGNDHKEEPTTANGEEEGKKAKKNKQKQGRWKNGNAGAKLLLEKL